MEEHKDYETINEPDLSRHKLVRCEHCDNVSAIPLYKREYHKCGNCSRDTKTIEVD